MPLRVLLAALVVLAPALTAQEDLKLALGFPASTVVYFEVAEPEILQNLSQREFLQGIMPGAQAPDIRDLLSRMELNLSADELKGLTEGVRRVSVGLLDIALSGPRLQVLVDHKHTAPLEKALKEAVGKVPSVQLAETFEDVAIYALQLPVRAPGSKPGMMGMMFGGGIRQWLGQMDQLWLGVYKGRYVIAATTLNAVKDALDFIAFPDDTTDTLLGNVRYREALAEFVKPQGLLFVNTNSMIQTLERILGDKGRGPGGGARETMQFVVGLVEYKQLKSLAAGFWTDDAKRTLRMDARLQFHFAPGWYSATRAAPRPQALAEYIPADAVFALTNNLENPGDVFAAGRDFVRERAREAGRHEVLKEIDKLESTFRQEGVDAKETLNELGAAALVVVPVAGSEFVPLGTVFVVRMKDPAKFPDKFYSVLQASNPEARHSDRNIEFYEGVEIHYRDQGTRRTGFAFLDDVIINGDYEALRSMIKARKEKRTLANSPAFNEARGALWQNASGSMILNFGSVIKTLGGIGPVRKPQAKAAGVEDCTIGDDNPSTHLADFFAETVVVVGVLGRDNEINIRYVAARWPSRAQFKELSALFKNVARNKVVRDRLGEVQRATSAYYALKGKSPENVTELVEAGYVLKAELVVDPFSDGEAQPRDFRFAPQADKADIRQGILLAYQEKPGLRNRHMAVLWTGDVVSLDADELKDALDRAKKGEAVKGRRTHKPLTDPQSTVPSEGPDRRFR